MKLISDAITRDQTNPNPLHLFNLRPSCSFGSLSEIKCSPISLPRLWFDFLFSTRTRRARVWKGKQLPIHHRKAAKRAKKR